MPSLSGICQLCGCFGKLTFEHIPPQRVFNSRPAVVHTLWGMGIGSKHSKLPPVEQHRRGMGRESLCEKCNGKTASYFGDAFADWTFQALEYAKKVNGDNRVALPFSIKPLNVIKQIATMAIAAAPLSDSPSLRELRRFILSPFEQYLPGGFRIRAYLNPARPQLHDDPMLTPNRMSGPSAIMDIKAGKVSNIYCEVAFPPMGYVVFCDDPDKRLTDQIASLAEITFFGRFRYGQRADVMVNLPVRNPFGPVPGNYLRA